MPESGPVFRKTTGRDLKWLQGMPNRFSQKEIEVYYSESSSSKIESSSDKIQIDSSESSDSCAQVQTPVSALSDVHQRGLRAVSLHQVLSKGGELAGPRLRKEDHDKFSRELAILKFEYFISHNWQVERWRKFLTLAS
eukprot:Skav235845  [mRNA]  locus=scaffold1931:370724:382557:- [translate_table: standard]